MIASEDPRHPAADPLDRRSRDGDAGAGDMLGGLGAGAGDRLGPDFDEEDDRRAMRGNQHSFAGEEFQIDAGVNYHGADTSA